LSVQYIPDRNLPDKAIDLIDEAGSRKSMSGSEVVTEEDIAQVIASWKGVLILTSGQKKKRILDLEQRLKSSVIGQDHAIEATCGRLIALRNPDRPIGSFIFMGPTGVGKSLIPEKLAEFLFADPKALVQIDMSEYQEKFSVSRLIGAPPGYVGHDEGGQLTEKVRRKPFCVVLLDEIEKAHVDVFDLLLQVLEKGHLTDGQGRSVSFKNTIIIMTSNVRPETSKRVGFGADESSPSVDEALAAALMKRGFRREFLNRVDQIVLFHELGPVDLQSIVDLELTKTKQILHDQHMELTDVTTAVKDHLIAKGYSQQYGARNLRRTIERLILTPLGRLIMEGQFQEGDHITANLKEGSIVFSK
jgi:ATP-dependent Clp protease ATP-binding subunit ClpA